MKGKIKSVLLILTVLVIAGSINAWKKLNIAATNSWTAAYVSAAGVYDAVQLAPSDMVHPPEYELKPSDVKKIVDADLLVFAGYEVMMKTVFDSFGKTDNKLLKIETGYSREIMKKNIMAIAEKTGTIAKAEKNINAIDDFFMEAHKTLKKEKLYGMNVIVNFHQKPFAESLGFKVIGVFGPGPLQTGKLNELGHLKPDLIIDNVHNPMGSPVAEITGAPIVELVNFPGYKYSDGTAVPQTLIGVMKHNFKKIVSCSAIYKR